MRAGLILNGISLKKKTFYDNWLPKLSQEFSVEVFETRSRHHAIELAAKAVYKKFDLLIAAGGDGTVHQVVNGLLQENVHFSKLPVLAVLPLGGGNDFARALNMTHDIDRFIQKIKSFRIHAIDIGELTCRKERTGLANHHRYFVNVADTGMGPEVVERVLKSGRAFGSAIAYYHAIIATFFSYVPPRMNAKSDTFEWNDRIRTFAVANGRYFGSGLCIGPDARLDDHEFDVFACGPVTILDFLLQSIPLKRGRRISHRHVKYFKCTELTLSGEQDLGIEADGEFCGWLPATIRLSQVKLNVLE